MDVPDGEAARELGAIAHGPVLLASGDGIAVGLRCVFAHRTGLHLPVILIARDVHADAAAHRLRGSGDELRLELGPSDGAAPVRLPGVRDTGRRRRGRVPAGVVLPASRPAEQFHTAPDRLVAGDRTAALPHRPAAP